MPPSCASKFTVFANIRRESSAQTRPWLPEITCYADTEDDADIPEVVYVADLIDSTITYPGLREVEIVERARKRRMWENALPPITSPDDIPSRAAALEAFEWEEWIAREKEINECQQARLKIVADLIAKRETKHLTDTNQKLENCKKRILDERKHKKDILMCVENALRVTFIHLCLMFYLIFIQPQLPKEHAKARPGKASLNEP